jgi:MFS family permease
MANQTPSPQGAGPTPLAVVLAGALSLAVAMGIGRFAFTPLLPLMIRDGQLDVAAGGWLAAANYAGYLLGALTAARLRWPPVRLSVVALLLTAVLTAAMGWAGSLWLGMLLRLAAGVCSAWGFVATSLWCLAALARLQRPAWSSGLYAGVGLGIAVAGSYCLVAAGAGVSARSLWAQLGLLALLLSLPVALVLRSMGGETAAAPAHRAASAVPGSAGLVVCYGILGFGYILPATYLPVLARTVVEDPRLFGLAWPVFGLTAALSTLLAARWLQRATRLQVWAVAHLLMGIGVLLPSLWLSGLTVGLSALLVGGTFMIVTMAGVQEIRARAPADAAAWVGRMTAAFALGQIAGPVSASLLLHLAGPDNGLNLALQVGAASLGLSALWLWRQTQASSIPKEISHVR